MRWLDGITDTMDINLNTLQEMVKDRAQGVGPEERVIWSLVRWENGA